MPSSRVRIPGTRPSASSFVLRPHQPQGQQPRQRQQRQRSLSGLLKKILRVVEDTRRKRERANAAKDRRTTQRGASASCSRAMRVADSLAILQDPLARTPTLHRIVSLASEACSAAGLATMEYCRTPSAFALSLYAHPCNAQ